MPPLRLPAAVLALALSLPHGASAQSALSADVSALPVASLVGATAASGAAAASTVLSAGAVLSVKAVEASATGVVYVLERAADGARVSVQVAMRAAGASALAVGTAVTVSATGAGLVLAAAGEALAFIPNEVGKSLLHHEKISH